MKIGKAGRLFDRLFYFQNGQTHSTRDAILYLSVTAYLKCWKPILTRVQDSKQCWEIKSPQCLNFVSCFNKIHFITERAFQELVKRHHGHQRSHREASEAGRSDGQAEDHLQAGLLHWELSYQGDQTWLISPTSECFRNFIFQIISLRCTSTRALV